MNKRLPPLNAIRAFEATSRLMSAKQAAEELYVTPAAISHQIKALEEHLNVKLFKRLNRQLLLTEAGQKYAVFLHEFFKRLADETHKIRQKEKNILRVTTEPAFAMYWLIPRINEFKKKHKDIELKISASYKITDFEKNDFDVGIRWGNGRYPGLESAFIFCNEVYPVCSPSLIKKHKIKKPNDLKYYTLLHETTAIAQTDYPDWHVWVNEFHAEEVDPHLGLHIETGYLLIQAAIAGQGIALERAAFIEPLIQEGKLIKLFNEGIKESVNAYYAVYQKNSGNNTNIQTLIKWLQAEANKMSRNS